MKTRHIHIMGASGSGTTTLGRAVADTLAIPHHDTDDYYWLPTSPPYRERRELADRIRLMHELFLGRDAWVLSGSMDSWSAAIAPFFDLVVFLTVAREIRLERLRERDARQFGETELLPGGKRHQETEEFIAWASHYEDGTRDGRSLPRHEAWLATLSCPVIRLDGAREKQSLVDEIHRALSR
jgi:adenylate kinase family enzyme